MFQCQVCQSTNFHLAIQPGCHQPVRIRTTEHQDVMIDVGDRQFVADLAFMNRYAHCHCGVKGRWAYYYPQKAKTLS